MDKRNNNRVNNYKVNKPVKPVRIQKGPSAESIIDRIVGHMILAAVLLLLGLLVTDRSGLRGFPFGWFHQPQFTRYDNLIASFLVLLAVTVCADLIASAIGRIKEPAMKLAAEKAPRTVSAETVVVPTERARKENVRRPAAAREAKTLIRQANDNKAFGSKKSKNKLSALIWIVVGIAILSFIGAAVDDNEFDVDDSSDYDTEYSNDAGDYDPYEYYTVEDIADDVIYHFKWGEYDALKELGDTKALEDVGDLSFCQYELFKNQYYTTDDKKHAVFKYILSENKEDEDMPVYLVGLLIGGDVTEDYPKETKVEGITVYKFGTHDEFETFYNSDDGAVTIDSSKCVSLGEVEAEETFILNMK